MKTKRPMRRRHLIVPQPPSATAAETSGIPGGRPKSPAPKHPPAVPKNCIAVEAVSDDPLGFVKWLGRRMSAHGREGVCWGFDRLHDNVWALHLFQGVVDPRLES